MKSCIVLCTAVSLAWAGPVWGQSEEQQVMAVVQGVFDAMAEADSAWVRSLAYPGAQLITTGAGEAGVGVRVLPMERFIAAVGGADGWRERIWDPEVRIDGTLASAWMQYDFHLNGEFSHCGVNSFQLAKTADGWKIVGIADSRRTENCEEPPGG